MRTTKAPDYADLIRIDPDALDVEWVEQPGRFLHLAEQLAHARKSLETAEQNYEVQEAKVAKSIREEATGKRMTEGAIKEHLARSPKLTEAKNEIIQTRYEMEILAAAVRAMDVRKQALENLVRLQGQAYFAGPKEPRDLSLEVAKRQSSRRVQDKIRGAGRE